MKREMTGVIVEVVHKESKYEWNQYRNTFCITISGNGEKLTVESDIYDKEKITEVTDEMFSKLVIEIYEACFVNSEAYDSFEEWCYDWGYNENDNDDEVIYQESIERGDKLINIINQEWLDTVETFIVMADIKTT